jgi:hypothetical protein
MTPQVTWRKSTYSTEGAQACVEVALTTAFVGVRDSKNTAGPALAFDRTAWQAFLDAQRGV